VKLVWDEGARAVIFAFKTKKCRSMLASGNFHSCGALVPKVSGKILVYKQWGVGYQRFDAINMVKKRKIQIKEKTNNSNKSK
jgi:hypothetical protein